MSVAMGLLLVTSSGVSQCDPCLNGKQDRITGLISQLGDAKYVKREAAMKRLKAIGIPALAALLKAAASHGDVEIRLRARQLAQAINSAVVSKELNILEGTWTGTWVRLIRIGNITTTRSTSIELAFKAGRCDGRDKKGEGTLSYFWYIVDATTSPKKVDLITAAGKHFRAIYELDGDTLQCCFSSASPEAARPQSFATHTRERRIFFKVKRVRKDHVLQNAPRTRRRLSAEEKIKQLMNQAVEYRQIREEWRRLMDPSRNKNCFVERIPGGLK
jgi:uncharacterized protein (TIGR03067 family)